MMRLFAGVAIIMPHSATPGIVATVRDIRINATLSR
jgi:hypothetical protein